MCWFLPYNNGISHNYTYIPCLWSLPPTPHLSRSSQSTRLGSLYYTATSHHLSILNTWHCIYILMLLSPFIPLSHHVQKSILCVLSPFLPCKYGINQLISQCLSLLIWKIGIMIILNEWLNEVMHAKCPTYTKLSVSTVNSWTTGGDGHQPLAHSALCILDSSVSVDSTNHIHHILW